MQNPECTPSTYECRTTHAFQVATSQTLLLLSGRCLRLLVQIQQAMKSTQNTKAHTMETMMATASAILASFLFQEDSRCAIDIGYEDGSECWRALGVVLPNGRLLGLFYGS